MFLELILGLLISYLLLFILSLILKDNSIVDIFWGIGFLQITIHSLILSNTLFIEQILLLILILIWSFRISFYILYKRIKRGSEDLRYVYFRKNWKHFYLRSIFQIYLLQALLLFIISLPIIFFNIYPQNMSILFIIGLIIALCGLIFETISDYQLFQFIHKIENKNKLMQNGLFKYSRHPNYFGESIFWLGICLIAFNSSIYSFLSYITITILLRYVSGVPMSEKNYLERDDFKEYAKKTPPFIPNFFIK